MLAFRPDRPDGRVGEVLFLGAHSDDIEIGCGGTVIELLKADPDVRITWVVLSSNPEREKEARRSAARFLQGGRNSQVIVKSFRNAFFPVYREEIKEFFEELKSEVAPDLIVTHCREDLHQDHRVVGELTWNTWRDHPIFEYEIPKYDGGLGSPNQFVALSAGTLEAKVRILLEEFGTQRSRSWFTEETFRALPRLRGIECNAPEGLAEAFYCRKTLIKF